MAPRAFAATLTRARFAASSYTLAGRERRPALHVLAVDAESARDERLEASGGRVAAA